MILRLIPEAREGRPPRTVTSRSCTVNILPLVAYLVTPVQIKRIQRFTDR
jgi:hypothetical protein